MPPTNDNFANAQVLDPNANGIASNQTAFAVSVGSNIGATAEPGEPQFGLKSVWYKITIPFGFPSTIYFSTTRNRQPKPLRTFLQVFQVVPGATPSPANLHEVTYLAAYKTGYGGWDLGSMVAISILDNNVYYIRVDGVNGAEGNFQLTYGQYFNLKFGSCSGCAAIFTLGYSCVGTSGAYDFTTSPLVGFGKNSYPPGRYSIHYCGGSVHFLEEINDPEEPFTDNYILQATGDGIDIAWSAYYNGSTPANRTAPGAKPTTQRMSGSNITTLTVPAHGFKTGQHVAVSGINTPGYNVTDSSILVLDVNHITYRSTAFAEGLIAETSGIVTPVNQSSLKNAPFYSEDEFFSQVACETANVCAFTQFDHIGGDIKLGVSCKLTTPDRIGPDQSHNPKWGLYVVSPVLQLVSSPQDALICVTWLTLPSGGTPGTARASFTILNRNDTDWDQVSATMLPQGGVLTPLTTTNITLPGLNYGVFFVDFSAMDTNVVATLVLTCGFWAAPIEFTVNAAPIIKLVTTTGPTLDVVANGFKRTCGGKKIYSFSAFVQNVGYWSYGQGDLTIQATTTNGVLVGSWNTGLIDGLHGGKVPISVCPSASTASVQPYNGLPCFGGFGSGNQTIALVAPPSATAPVKTVLTLAFSASGIPLFSQDFPLTVQL